MSNLLVLMSGMVAAEGTGQGYLKIFGLQTDEKTGFLLPSDRAVCMPTITGICRVYFLAGTCTTSPKSIDENPLADAKSSKATQHNYQLSE